MKSFKNRIICILSFRSISCYFAAAVFQSLKRLPESNVKKKKNEHSKDVPMFIYLFLAIFKTKNNNKFLRNKNI